MADNGCVAGAVLCAENGTNLGLYPRLGVLYVVGIRLQIYNQKWAMISKSVRKTEKSLQKVFVICRYRQEMLYHNRKTTGPQDFFSRSLEVSKSRNQTRTTENV